MSTTKHIKLTLCTNALHRISSHALPIVYVLFLLPLLLLNASKQTHAQSYQGSPGSSHLSIDADRFETYVKVCYGMQGSRFTSPAYNQASRLSQASPMSALSSQRQQVQQQQQQQQPPASRATGFSSPDQTATSFEFAAKQPNQIQTFDSADAFRNALLPRARSMENFLAILSKLEAAFPALAHNVEAMIKLLLTRFRYDDYTYARDGRHVDYSRVKDKPRADRIASAMLAANQATVSNYELERVERVLDASDKCAIYFMLSHWVEPQVPMSPAAGRPIDPLSTPQFDGGSLPYLAAAGTGYPSRSAQQPQAGGGVKFSGPSPGFGSPSTAQVHAFDSGVNVQNTDSSYGMNTPANRQTVFAQARNSNRANFQTNPALYNAAAGSGSGSNSNYYAIYESGVVSVGYQDNSAVALSRVLLGILAARQQRMSLNDVAQQANFGPGPMVSSSRMSDDIDPLLQLTLADLWAHSAKPAPFAGGSTSDLRRPYGPSSGLWSNSFCPTSFRLRSPVAHLLGAPFVPTVAELLGGLDGYNLGMLRRELGQFQSKRTSAMRLSDLLRAYYSKDALRTLAPRYGVCERGVAINSMLDTLRAQAESYYRLLELDLPTSDMEIVNNIATASSFKDNLRQAAADAQPRAICDTSFESQQTNQATRAGDQCEVAKADVAVVLDSQATDQLFMTTFAVKLARALGLSRVSSSLTVLTDQVEGDGFNAILRNSTNTADVGCALLADDSNRFAGGQVTDPIRLVNLFKQTLRSLRPTDSLYFNSAYRAQQSSPSSSQAYSAEYQQQAQQLSLFPTYATTSNLNTKTSGAKVIVYFNYNTPLRPSSLVSYPQQTLSSPTNNEDFEYRLSEAKKSLRENYAGAMILVAATNKADAKQLVEDENRDIFSLDSSSAFAQDVPVMFESNFVPNAQVSLGDVSARVEPLVNGIVNRLCEAPAEFEYPACYLRASANDQSVGYISPGKSQYWIMAPRTFFSSKTIRLGVRADAGRLRVCIGRNAFPERTSNYMQQDQNSPQQYQMSGLLQQTSTQSSLAVAPSYAELERGVCRDALAKQEIEFTIDDPCWHSSSIATCQPIYFYIKETSSPGDIPDQAYACVDEACQRPDQVKFVLTHSGVECSSAVRAASVSLVALACCVIISSTLNWQPQAPRRVSVQAPRKSLLFKMYLAISSIAIGFAAQAQAQQAGVYDFGQNRYGEKRGNFTPYEILSVVLLIMVIVSGLAFTICLCYYVWKQDNKRTSRLTPVSTHDDEEIN